MLPGTEVAGESSRTTGRTQDNRRLHDLVIMAMVQVGPMRMPVRDRPVAMPMSVADRFSFSGMFMPVMSVVMPMAMFMVQLFMEVLVVVSIAKDHHQRTAKPGHCRQLYGRYGFAQEERRQQDSEKRTAGEEHLTSRRTDVLSGGNIKHDTCSI